MTKEENVKKLTDMVADFVGFIGKKLPDDVVAKLKELGDKLSAEDKATVENELAEFKKVRETNDAEQIKNATEAFTQKVYAVFGKIYQQQGAGDAVTQSAGLAGNAAALHGSNDVHLAQGIGGVQGLTDHHLQGLQTEVIVDVAAVDGDGAGAVGE